MVCNLRNLAEEAKRIRAERLKKLIERLKTGQARFVKVGNKVSIEGWDERGEWCDDCAIRQMRLSTDIKVRQMVENAAPVNAVLTFGHGHTHGHGQEHSHGGITHRH